MKDLEIVDRIHASIGFLVNKRLTYKNDVVMRAETFVAIQEKLEEIIGKPSVRIMFKLGAEIGKQNMGKKEKDMNKALEVVRFKGWGSLKSVKKTKKGMIICFDDTFISGFHKKVDYKTCAFISGFLSQFSQKTFGKDMKEYKCVSRGDDCCEFRPRE